MTDNQQPKVTKLPSAAEATNNALRHVKAAIPERPDDLDEILGKLEASVLHYEAMGEIKGGQDGYDDYMPRVRANAKQLLLAWRDSHTEKKVLEGRLIELDLFEQFLNQHKNKDITRGDLHKFKMERLKNLGGRLEKLEKKEKK